MLTLSTSRRARIEARISSINSQITALETAIDSAVTKDVEEYSFNSGDGSQRVIYKSLDEMQIAVDKLYRMLEYQYNLLRGRGIVQMVARRR